VEDRVDRSLSVCLLTKRPSGIEIPVATWKVAACDFCLKAMTYLEDLRGGGWFRMDNTVIDDHGATPGAYSIAVHAVPCRFANNDTQEAYPSLATIARLIGCSKPMVIKSLKTLETEGLICIEKVKSKHGDYDHNRYWLLALGGGDSQSHDQGSWNKGNGIWLKALTELEMQTTKGTFTRWLAGSVLVSLKDSAATVQVHDSYAVEWCSTRLLTPIQRTLAGILGSDVAVTLTT